MFNMAKRQTLQLWIALLAILFSALAPTVSHALAAANPAETVQICTVDGYKLVQLPDADDGKAPLDLKHGMEHCAFCTLHGGGDAPLPHAVAALSLNPDRDTYPSLFYSAPRALHVWSVANPRAPPALA
jgi:hypothetical protein